MRVVKAKKADLVEILGWLEREYDEDSGQVFWNNRETIERSFTVGNLWVIREGGKAVAFQVGDYSAAIANVRKDKQRQGFGSALVTASVRRAMRDDVNVLSGECSPRSSLPFWRKQGFERYGDMSEWGTITVRRVLERELDVPVGLPRVEVIIGFYPESAIYVENVPPISIHRVAGGTRVDGVVLLERRVIGLLADEPEEKDLVVKIEGPGRARYFCKAKYGEARDAGVMHDSQGGCFYLDAVRQRTL